MTKAKPAPRNRPTVIPPDSNFGIAPDHELSMALRRAYMRLHRDTCAHCAELDVTADQFVMMNVIKSVGSAKQNELVLLTDSDANTVSAMLRRLQRRGLVTRRTHATDSRAKTVELTAEGTSLLEDLEKRTKKNRVEMQKQFSQEELTGLIALLRRLATYKLP